MMKISKLERTTYEYTNIEANPVESFNRADFGKLGDANRLSMAKQELLDAIKLFDTYDISKISDEKDRNDSKDTKDELDKIKDNLLGVTPFYVYEENSSSGALKSKTYFDVSALYNPSTALTIGSTYGHNFYYSKHDESINIDGNSYIKGDYNLTLSQIENNPMT